MKPVKCLILITITLWVIRFFKTPAVCAFLQIGELCKVLSEELRMQVKAVPWKEWCGIRDIFAHQYSNLDCQSAWDTIQQDLPELKTEIDKILQGNEE